MSKSWDRRTPELFLTATQREIEQAAKRVQISVSVAWVEGPTDLERQIVSIAAEKSAMLLVEGRRTGLIVSGSESSRSDTGCRLFMR